MRNLTFNEVQIVSGAERGDAAANGAIVGGATGATVGFAMGVAANVSGLALLGPVGIGIGIGIVAGAAIGYAVYEFASEPDYGTGYSNFDCYANARARS
ncbi:MAG: hypothetical protein ACR2PR_10665 [Pseudohongiellaceae bacterium]